MLHPYVIFDRDGTLIEHVHHLIDPNLVIFKGGIIEALTKLQDHGFKFGIISNQSVVGRGLASMDTVNLVNQKIIDYLNSNDIKMQFVLAMSHGITLTLCKDDFMILADKVINELFHANMIM